MPQENEPEFQPRPIQEIRHWIKKMGWNSEETFHSTDYRIKAWRRDGEHLCLIWRIKIFSSAESWFESPEVERVVVSSEQEAISALRTCEPTFDFAEMSDEAALHYLRGKEIFWMSAYTNEKNKAVIPASQSTYLSRSRMGRRFITFADTAFRSVGLDAIVEIR
jgi:hypothetical protein